MRPALEEGPGPEIDDARCGRLEAGVLDEAGIAGFGEDLPVVRAAMEALAKFYSPDELAEQAYALDEQFRPTVPEGQRGWGAAGSLDLGRIRRMARRTKN